MSRCLSCPNEFRCVPGDGPEPARVLFIGGMPGKEEDAPRPMFSGKSGKEFNETYLALAGLDRDEIRITNSRKCRNESGKKPEDADTLACASHHLPDEIESCAPEFIVLMGAAACSLIPDLNLEIEHGIPRYDAELFGWTGTIIPMDHPSGGMHDTSLMIPLLEDFARLRTILDGTYEPVSSHRIPAIYSYVTTAQQVHDSIPLGSPNGEYNGTLSIDMEDHAGVPYSIQWCSEPGRAYMLRLTDDLTNTVTRRLLGARGSSAQQAFQECLEYFVPNGIILHNASGDLDALNALGIHYSGPIRDTMQEAYHQGNLPQGLKALGFRLLGIRMREWKEVVGPPSRAAVLNWVESAIDAAETLLTITVFQQLKTKVKKVIKAHPVEKRLRAIFRYTCYNDEYPIWKHLTELRDKEPDFARVESTLGPVPQMGIGNCTPEEALEYACKDADVTYRVAQILDTMRKQPELKIHPNDWDKIAVAK